MSGEADDVPDLYTRLGPDWAGTRDISGFELHWIDRIAELIPAGATVMDLGGGAGRPIGTTLAERGFRVIGVDVSPSLQTLYREAVPTAQTYLADMRALDLPVRVDAIIMFNSFFHLSMAAQRAALPRICGHLKPGGVLFFSCGPQAGEKVGTVAGEPVFHASLEPVEYAQILADQGLRLRAFVAEDPATRGHSLILAKKT
ncbi:MAG: class I SAM-dependent methyltransferase [Pseudomonadota bacterium]